MKWFELCKDPRWQKKRLEILNRDDWRCCNCSDNKSTLHIHHNAYYGIKDKKTGKMRRRKPWEYNDKALITLCDSCHECEHDKESSYESDLISVLKLYGFLNDDLYVLISEVIDGKILPHHIKKQKE